MHAIARVLVALTFAGSISTPTKPDSTDKRDGDRIQGTWKCQAMFDQGRKMPWPDGNRIVITSDMLRITYPNGERRGWKFTIDPSKDPKEMDWLVEEEPGHPIRQLAIYKLEGDTLTICSTAAGKPRPTNFESWAGDFGGVWVLKRDLEATTKPK